MTVTSTSIPATDHVGLTTRFLVAIDGVRLGGWATCEGLAVTFDLLTYKPLGQNDYLPVLPNRLIYPNITLTRAITQESAPTVMQWLSKMAGSGAGATAEITLLNPHREKVTSWKLKGVYPVKWKGPSLNAKGHDIATETLELAHEGFLDV
jgi:phage tail-like protein